MTITRDTPTRPETARAYTERMVEKTVLLADISPHPDNPRQHPDTQIQQLAASHSTLGQFEPVVLWSQPDGKYIQVKGHGYAEGVKVTQDERVKAWILPEDTPPAFVTQIMLASNLHALNSYDDTGLLSKLLQEQQELGIDLAALGTSEENLQALLDELESEHEDAYIEGAGGDDYEVNPDAVEVRCKRGELWQLGKHRLLVDDSTKVENVEKLMQGKRASLMATDPPYGDSWVQKARDMQEHGYVHSRAVLHGSIESDDLGVIDLKAFLITFLEAAKGAGDAPMPFYVWHRAKRIVFEQALIETGYFVHQPIVWVKPGFVIGRLHYHPRCEWALHGWRQGSGKCPFYGERNQSDVWEVARENDKIHPTQKPLQLFDTPILNHTKAGEICYDPFAGSGTQVISAERLGRRCYAMEIDETYATIILNRWEAETGDTARLLERSEEVTHAL